MRLFDGDSITEEDMGVGKRAFGLTGRFGLAGLTLCMALYASACGGTSTPPPAPAASPMQQFHLEGKIVSVDKQQQQLVVDHKEIPGYMGAMTMPYPVKTATALDQVGVGDEIKADLIYSDGQYRLENITVVKKADPKAAPPIQGH
jgi:protein SCO1/2